MSRRPHLARQPCHRPPRIRIHRQKVDDVGPVVAPPIAVAERQRDDRIAGGLLVDQDAAEVVARFRIERLEDGAEVGHSSAYFRGRFNASRAASTDA
jgi:hypothetical protein